jgi:hypothetical protein
VKLPQGGQFGAANISDSKMVHPAGDLLKWRQRAEQKKFMFPETTKKQLLGEGLLQQSPLIENRRPWSGVLNLAYILIADIIGSSLGKNRVFCSKFACAIKIYLIFWYQHYAKEGLPTPCGRLSCCALLILGHADITARQITEGHSGCFRKQPPTNQRSGNHSLV